MINAMLKTNKRKQGKRQTTCLFAVARPLALECAMFLAVCCFLLLALVLCYTLNPMDELVNLIFTDAVTSPIEFHGGSTLSHYIEAQPAYVPL
jgi:hypothetical protein